MARSPRDRASHPTPERRRGGAPVLVGCSGWNYASWRGRLYAAGVPASRWLEEYARHFDTVEVNSTFYRLPRAEAVARWVTQTPDGFAFAVKASRYLTHVKRLADVQQGLARFYERVEPLRAAGRLAVTLWQLPESFHRDPERIAGTLEHLPPGRHAFEFRHPSWFCDEVYELLRAHGAALVIGDHPERPFQTITATTAWRYVRFHHGHRGRRGNYSPRALERWSERLHAWSAEGEVFAYFNNDWEGFAPRNAAALRRDLRNLDGAGRAASSAGAAEG